MTTIKINNQELCLIDEAIKRAKERGETNLVLGLSCPCPKCSPRC